MKNENPKNKGRNLVRTNKRIEELSSYNSVMFQTILTDVFGEVFKFIARGVNSSGICLKSRQSSGAIEFYIDDQERYQEFLMRNYNPFINKLASLVNPVVQYGSVDDCKFIKNFWLKILKPIDYYNSKYQLGIRSESAMRHLCGFLHNDTSRTSIAALEQQKESVTLQIVSNQEANPLWSFPTLNLRVIDQTFITGAVMANCGYALEQYRKMGCDFRDMENYQHIELERRVTLPVRKTVEMSLFLAVNQTGNIDTVRQLLEYGMSVDGEWRIGSCIVNPAKHWPKTDLDRVEVLHLLFSYNSNYPEERQITTKIIDKLLLILLKNSRKQKVVSAAEQARIAQVLLNKRSELSEGENFPANIITSAIRSNCKNALFAVLAIASTYPSETISISDLYKDLVTYDRKNMVEILIEYGRIAKDQRCESKGEGLIHYSVRYDNKSFIKFLVDLGFDKKIVRPKDGWSALHLAAFFSKVSMINYLNDLGFDCSQKDVKNHTSLQLAAKAQKKASVEVLEAIANDSPRAYLAARKLYFVFGGYRLNKEVTPDMPVFTGGWHVEALEFLAEQFGNFVKEQDLARDPRALQVDNILNNIVPNLSLPTEEMVARLKEERMFFLATGSKTLKYSPLSRPI